MAVLLRNLVRAYKLGVLSFKHFVICVECSINGGFLPFIHGVFRNMRHADNKFVTGYNQCYYTLCDRLHGR